MAFAHKAFIVAWEGPGGVVLWFRACMGVRNLGPWSLVFPVAHRSHRQSCEPNPNALQGLWFRV